VSISWTAPSSGSGYTLSSSCCQGGSLVLVIVVVPSLGLALLCRRRYVAAVVRLQGRSLVQRNESWSTPPTVRPLRLVAEELADGASPNVAAGILQAGSRCRMVEYQNVCNLSLPGHPTCVAGAE
jgi:hypothetical protein